MYGYTNLTIENEAMWQLTKITFDNHTSLVVNMDAPRKCIEEWKRWRPIRQFMYILSEEIQ
jgi:hypothetical protein